MALINNKDIFIFDYLLNNFINENKSNEINEIGLSDLGDDYFYTNKIICSILEYLETTDEDKFLYINNNAREFNSFLEQEINLLRSELITNYSNQNTSVRSKFYPLEAFKPSSNNDTSIDVNQNYRLLTV